jgi:hypothetical protein
VEILWNQALQDLKLFGNNIYMKIRLEQLHIGSIVEVNFNSHIVRGEVTKISKTGIPDGNTVSYLRSDNKIFAGYFEWDVLPDYVELTNPDKGFRTYIHWVIMNPLKYKLIE